MKLKLYHYWRSSSSWRVRWGLALKGLPCEYVHIDLLNGEAEASLHRARNPWGYVPVVEVLDGPHQGQMLSESLPILEWLEETHPQATSLYPRDSWDRARVRQLAETINAGTQPIQNLSVLTVYSEDPAARKSWAQHWNREGLRAYEALAKASAGKFSFGDEVTVADLCLIPQCYNAGRFEISLEKEFPLLHRIYQNALQTPACQASAPESFQPAALKA